MRTPTFWLLLVAGLLIRLAALQMPVSEHAAARIGLGGQFHLAIASVTAGASAGAASPQGLAKLPGLMCAAVLVVLVYRVSEARTSQPALARWGALAIWLNPALILNGDALGYHGPLVMLPTALALLLAHAGAPLVAGASAALAAAISPSGALIVPALLVATRSLGFRLGMLRALAGGLLLAAPVVWLSTTGWWRPVTILDTFRSSDVLSANAANVWWLLSWGQGLRHTSPRIELAALRRITEPITLPPVVTFARRHIAISILRAGNLAVIVAWWLRACWQMLGTVRLSLHAALGAVTVHIFFVLMMGLRQADQILEVPLLALAAALEPRLRSVFYAVTAIVALNMNLFDGVSGGMRWAIPRGITFVDASVILAAVNVITLFWLSGLVADLALESRGAYSSRA